MMANSDSRHTTSFPPPMDVDSKESAWSNASIPVCCNRSMTQSDETYNVSESGQVWHPLAPESGHKWRGLEDTAEDDDETEEHGEKQRSNFRVRCHS